jgi:hypothetical protein
MSPVAEPLRARGSNTWYFSNNDAATVLFPHYCKFAVTVRRTHALDESRMNRSASSKVIVSCSVSRHVIEKFYGRHRN